ncbi:serine O-acetyltransferase EpsC [Methylocella tundrae]|uniref:serine O-acetyltransferase n=1 Tax=Methylocella tundrae TaxID=227605 RepID=A0A4U8Z2M1_METTU|nr:serine O-acetyltransferase EpsC [Methylocella tundrae]WPP03541.1 serine O-acetyltransferase EpsC [Methylocella tundrae]VFU09646.1 Serine acetyltransferase, plasmid [Methylocella tundrae]
MNPEIRKRRARESARPTWNIEAIVAELRDIRIKDHETREGPAKLPSRKILIHIMEGLAAALFPNRLGTCRITCEGVDFYVGHTLDVNLTELLEQLRLEFEFTSGAALIIDSPSDLAAGVVSAFAKELPKARALLDTDIRAAFDGDPAARSIDEVLICYPGVTAILHHRLAHVLYKLGAPLLARMIAEIAHSSTGIDIHPGAEIGESFFIDHGTGVVIGETTIIGKNVRLYQAVTLGAKRFPTDEHGALVKGGARHPIVEDDVVVYAGATILGRVTIGRGSSIGGNVWLTRSVPPGSTISQAQVRSEDFHDGAGI